jgi:energy-coupling factor transporter ATP-binding protein EcfA2
MSGVAELIIVTGPPGAGKTTVARALSKLFKPSARVLGDDFFAFIDQGYIAPWTAEAHHQNEIVVGAAAAAAGRLAAGGYTVVYDGVIGPWFLQTFGTATGLPRLHYVMLLPPEAVCIDRVRLRVGHGFSDLDAAHHMYREFAEAATDDRHVMTTPAPAEVVAASILALVLDGSVIRTINGTSSRPN